MRGPREVGSGDSDLREMMNQIPEQEETLSLFKREHQRLVLRKASERLRPKISPSIWDAFWLTAVEELSIADAAKKLGKSQGAVRVARCRVLAQLRKEVQADDCPFTF